MKFKYKKIAPGVIRPIIPIEIQYKGRKVRYEVLVDSGADSNIFDEQIGNPLGVKINSGKKGTAAGITGTPQTIYAHKVKIVVGGYEYATEANFMLNMPPNVHAVVGQKGFFDLFVVKFDYQKAVLDLKPKT